MAVLAVPASLSRKGESDGKTHSRIDSWLAAIRLAGGERRVREVEQGMAAMLEVAQKHLEVLFGADRVVVYHRRLPLVESKQTPPPLRRRKSAPSGE